MLVSAGPRSDAKAAPWLCRGCAGSVVVVARTCKGSGLFEVEGGGETLLMSGRIRVQPADAQVPQPPATPAPSTPSAEAVTLTGQDVLADLAAKGIAFTDKYRALKSIQIVSDHGTMQ